MPSGFLCMSNKANLLLLQPFHTPCVVHSFGNPVTKANLYNHSDSIHWYKTTQCFSSQDPPTQTTKQLSWTMYYDGFLLTYFVLLFFFSFSKRYHTNSCRNVVVFTPLLISFKPKLKLQIKTQVKSKTFRLSLYYRFAFISNAFLLLFRW